MEIRYESHQNEKNYFYEKKTNLNIKLEEINKPFWNKYKY